MATRLGTKDYIYEELADWARFPGPPTVKILLPPERFAAFASWLRLIRKECGLYLESPSSRFGGIL